MGEWDTTVNPDSQDNDEADPVLDIAVVERIPHEQYVPTSKTQENDIALLRLARSVTFTDWIRPICLPIRSHLRNVNYNDVPLVVAGWGKTETG